MAPKPYTCPRCGYNCRLKSDMKKHLYDKKKPCPKIEADIELTDEVKACVIENRIYHIPVPEVKPTINQTINNYNTMNNFIAGLDAIEKLEKYMLHQDTKLINFEDTVEDKFADHAMHLDNNDLKYDCKLRKQHLLEIIDEVSKVCTKKHKLRDFNVMYDTQLDKLRLYDSGEWEEMLIMSGIKRLIEIIQTVYLCYYEKYVIRKIVSTKTSPLVKQTNLELLEEYFKFIGCFYIEPHFKEKSDKELIESDHIFGSDDDSENEEVTYDDITYGDDTYDITERFWRMYIRIRDDIKQGDIKRAKAEVLSIIKRNTKKNIEELNKKVCSLFQIDKEFANTFMPILP